MNETPIQGDANGESNAVDQLVQRVWNRFAALSGGSINSEDDRPDGTRDLSAGDDDGREVTS